MFNSISPTYDLLNNLLSANVDKWRRRTAAQKLVNRNTHAILDVCGGTGDLALALEAQSRRLKVTPRIISSDFAPAMMAIASRKFTAFSKANCTQPIIPLVADTLSLPFRDAKFDLVTVAFGIRNVSDVQAGLAEMKRVCRLGGTIAVLEFSHPENPLFKAAYDIYFTRLLPWIGSKVARSNAYCYLTKSVSSFPNTREFAQMMSEVTGQKVTSKRLTFGIATLYFSKV